jgi:tripartite-type tricarboxylate transporter receptor subunit TctC
MGIDRRAFVAGAAAWPLAAPTVGAQGSRAGVTRLVLGFAPGGAADRVGRVLVPELARATGRGAIVENLPGANGLRAIQRVAASEPDGDTLLLATSAIAHPDNAAAMEALQPVVLSSTTPLVLVVRATLPAKDAREFARWLAANPGATYGSAGIGNATHLAAAELCERLNAKATHVPYGGATPAFGDLIGGHIDFLVMGAQPSLAQHPGARVLAVTTAARSTLPGLDALPTIGETLAPGFDFSLWQAIYAPSRVAPATVARLHAQFRDILAQPSVRHALADVGAEAIAGPPEAAERAFRAEAARHAVRAAR